MTGRTKQSRHVRHESAPIRTNFFLELIPRRRDPHDNDLAWPFGRIEGIDRDDVRETAYEIFFSSCRSAPGFGGRHALAFYSSRGGGRRDEGGSGLGFGSGPDHGVGVAAESRIKRELGLKKQVRIMPAPAMSDAGVSLMGGGQGLSLTLPAKTTPSRRHLTSAEIMRQQMRVTEQSDVRLRKTLMRTCVGQNAGRRAETIILPMELLRYLKPSEFNDQNEYHIWQRRQLRILEIGLILHPFAPLHPSLADHVTRLRDISRSSDLRPIDTRNPDYMRSLATSVLSLARRGALSDNDISHWADGYPFNVHLYISLLQAVFDMKEETVVLEEVDELMDLLKKTWPTLAITTRIHDACFLWTLFNQYVSTGQVEPDLLVAAHTLLSGAVATEAKSSGNDDAVYAKVLSAALRCLVRWSEKRLADYHAGLSKGNWEAVVVKLVPMVLLARRMLKEDVGDSMEGEEDSRSGKEEDEEDELTPRTPRYSFTENRVDFYIRSSLKNAFDKMVEEAGANEIDFELEESAVEILGGLAKGTEELAAKEKESHNNILKNWHPVAAGVAAVTLHNCYGSILQQYVFGVSRLSIDTINILQRAEQLEKVMVQMVVEDTVDCDDGGKSLVRQMVPYEVESTLLRLMRVWIEEKLQKSKDWIKKAKETETWNPKSKSEPFALSSMELMKQLKEIIDEFFELRVGISDDLLQDLADGLDRVACDYVTFVSSCGTKQNYMPTLPPLTRCSRDSKISKLWKKASCSVGIEDMHQHMLNDQNQPRPSTSRGTQRLYIRLNTLHHLLTHLNSLEKALSLSPPSAATKPDSFFPLSRASVHSAIHRVAEVAAYRLIFLDSHSVFYESMYVFDVTNARIKPALRVLKQNLTLLTAILIEKAQPLAIKEVMRASFEVFLMVLLAGGGTRIFSRTDHDMLESDFEDLKKLFCNAGVGLVAQEEVEREAEAAEGVIALMGRTTEEIVEDFCTVACERGGCGAAAGSSGAAGQKLPMPPTTGKWSNSDPNTMLRVLCHRNDHVANSFLKRSFQLPKRR